MEALLRQIGWTSGELARRLHARETSIRAMLRGNKPIPANLAVWLEDAAARTQGVPPLPEGWRKDEG